LHSYNGYVELSYSIKNLKISPGLVLSPMSGVTSSPFRRLIKELNPGAVGLLISEFISVEGLTRDSRRSVEMMNFHESERPYGVQIFGYDIDRMRDAAIMVEEAGADLVDINCGCPAPKVVKRGGGCELMRQPEHLTKIIREVRKAVSIPLTIKFRSGWDEESKNALEIAKIAESEGVDAIAVHGRTRAQLYRGNADWEVIYRIAEAVKIPVCGSGDVVDLQSAENRIKDSLAGFFIGRGAIANPFIFSQIVSGETAAPIPEVTMVRVIYRYVELLLEAFPPERCAGRLKQLVSQSVKAPWAKAMCRAQTLKAQLEILETVVKGSYQPVLSK
jgi:tRNA-dihydrouridine synthase B